MEYVIDTLFLRKCICKMEPCQTSKKYSAEEIKFTVNTAYDEL